MTVNVDGRSSGRGPAVTEQQAHSLVARVTRHLPTTASLGARALMVAKASLCSLSSADAKSVGFLPDSASEQLSEKARLLIGCARILDVHTMMLEKLEDARRGGVGAPW